MLDSPSGNEPRSPAESESSSDFEIQAVTAADGTRTETRPEESNKSPQNAHPQDKSEPVNEIHTSPKENLANALGLSAYSESSSSDDGYAVRSAVKPSNRKKKRVRFADDPPEKRKRVEHTNGRMNGPVSAHLVATGNDEADEVAVLAELAEFEAAVADTSRNTDDIEADLADAEDAREEAEQRVLEERVKRLREELARRRADTVTESVRDLEEEGSLSLGEDSDEGPDDLSKIGTPSITN